MHSFNDCNLSQELVDNISNIEYVNPSPIQQQVIPLVLDGSDVLGSSSTGSGKTAAFVIPIIEKILQDSANTKCLILAPTRELVQQISSLVKSLCGKIRFTVVFGGSSMSQQIASLKRHPNIIIATPGRIRDHIERKTVDMSAFNMFVLDEFDRMLDMGFKDEIQFLSSKLPFKRQTLMFSATDSKEVINLAQSYLKPNYETVTIETGEVRHVNIEQNFVFAKPDNKIDVLLESVKSLEGSIIIFANTKRMADSIEESLFQNGIKAKAIHGDLRQEKRERVIKRFRDEKFRILIATDIVARGIDINHIMHVINYDLPRTIDDYIHRIGRTGRFEAKGNSLALVTNRDRFLYTKILSKFELSDDIGMASRDAKPPAKGGKRSGIPPYDRKKRFSGDRSGNRSGGRDRSDRSNNYSSRSGGYDRPPRDRNDRNDRYERNDRNDRSGGYRGDDRTGNRDDRQSDRYPKKRFDDSSSKPFRRDDRSFSEGSRPRSSSRRDDFREGHSTKKLFSSDDRPRESFSRRAKSFTGDSLNDDRSSSGSRSFDKPFNRDGKKPFSRKPKFSGKPSGKDDGSFSKFHTGEPKKKKKSILGFRSNKKPK